jgi:hypothetical protein
VVLKSPGPAGGERLRSQSWLLETLRKIDDFSDLIPKLHEKNPDGSYSMDFFRGMKLGEFLSSASITEVRRVSEKLLLVLAASEERSISEGLEGLDRKIDEVGEKIEVMPISLFRIRRLVKQLDVLRLSLSDQQHGFPTNIPHGDFSMENILVSAKGERVCLIDPIPSPIQTRLLDAARIRLDLEYGWWMNGWSETAHFRLNNRELLSCLKLSWAKREGQVSALTALAAFRIIPYTKDPVRLAFLFRAIDEEMAL